MVDGTTDNRILIAYWISVAVFVIVPSVARRVRWKSEGARLRGAIVAELAGEVSDAGLAVQVACNQVDALVLCWFRKKAPRGVVSG